MNETVQLLQERLDGVATDFEREDVDEVEGVLHFRLATDTTEQDYMKPNSAVFIRNGMVQEFDIRIGAYDIDEVREAVGSVPPYIPHDGVHEGHGVDAPPHIRAYNVEGDVASLARFLRQLVEQLSED